MGDKKPPLSNEAANVLAIVGRLSDVASQVEVIRDAMERAWNCGARAQLDLATEPEVRAVAYVRASDKGVRVSFQFTGEPEPALKVGLCFGAAAAIEAMGESLRAELPNPDPRRSSGKVIRHNGKCGGQ